MKKEYELIIQLVRKDSIDADKVSNLISKNIDWKVFLDECTQNKVCAMIYYNLKKIKLLDKVPFYIYRMLYAYWNATVEKDNTYYEEISKIIHILESNKIEYAIIKGYDIINKLYACESRYMREFNDIDILISPNNIKKTLDVLNKMGFVYGDYDVNTDNIEKASRYDIIRMKMDSHQIYTLLKVVDYSRRTDGIRGPLFVDINFSVFEGKAHEDLIPINVIMEHTKKYKAFTGDEYVSLDKSYTAIQLFYHLYREAKTEELEKEKMDFTLHKFCDIYEYVKKFSNDEWEGFINIVKQYNLQQVVYFVLYYTDIIYSTQFVNRIIESCKNFDKTEVLIYESYFRKKYGMEDENL